jgi:hypothetical protein
MKPSLTHDYYDQAPCIVNNVLPLVTLMDIKRELLATTELECVIRGLEQANHSKRRMMGAR